MEVSITIDKSKCVSPRYWYKEIEDWAKQRHINLKWLGHSSHTTPERAYYKYDCEIANEAEATMFLLRWS